MRMIDKITILAALVIFASIPSSPVRAGQDDARANIVEEIKSKIPDMRLLGLDEFDAVSCGPVGDSPGLIEADFDGNGRRDFAVLLRSVVPTRFVEWQGKTHDIVNVKLIVLMAQTDGTYAVFNIENSEDLVPVGAWIRLQPPGKVTSWEKDESAVLSNPGIDMTYCEKSGFVAWWDRNAFRTIWTSD